MNRTNDQALELFADLMDPCSEIMGDKEIATMIVNGESRVKIAQTVVRKHKQSIIQILAMVEGEDPSEYKVDIFILPIKVLKFLMMEEVQELFPSQGQKTGGNSSGSATGSTEAKEN